MDSELADYIRKETGKAYVSDWELVDQALIDRFADTTRDWNYVHVDPERAAATELGGTIAHGFLLMSLLAPLRTETPRPAPPGARLGLNYGFDRIRFIRPVRAGSRVRARFTVAELQDKGNGQLREALDVELELEGQEGPAMVARWLTVHVF